MTDTKSPLQAHFEHMLVLKNLIDRWSLNSHHLICEHIKNINNAFLNTLDYPATMYYHHEHLKELYQAGKHEEYELFYELTRDREYLKDRVPLSDQEKLSFVQRVSARCTELDCGWAYNTITNELNEYLSFLLSCSPDINEREIYAAYKQKVGYSLLSRSYKSIKSKLPKHEFNQFFKELTQVPMFNCNDFSYVLSEDEETVNG